MKCFICNQTETVAGKTAVFLERGHTSLTINNVPAWICPTCGEGYAEEGVAVNLLLQAEQLARAGTKVEMCEYKTVE